jgi:hypothetical protein
MRELALKIVPEIIQPQYVEDQRVKECAVKQAVPLWERKDQIWEETAS